MIDTNLPLQEYILRVGASLRGKSLPPPTPPAPPKEVPAQ